jgi:hypothetical protein
MGPSLMELHLDELAKWRYTQEKGAPMLEVHIRRNEIKSYLDSFLQPREGRLVLIADMARTAAKMEATVIDLETTLRAVSGGRIFTKDEYIYDDSSYSLAPAAMGCIKRAIRAKLERQRRRLKLVKKNMARERGLLFEDAYLLLADNGFPSTKTTKLAVSALLQREIRRKT